jgi:hypothetical protein
MAATAAARLRPTPPRTPPLPLVLPAAEAARAESAAEAAAAGKIRAARRMKFRRRGGWNSGGAADEIRSPRRIKQLLAAICTKQSAAWIRKSSVDMQITWKKIESEAPAAIDAALKVNAVARPVSTKHKVLCCAINKMYR